MDILFLLTPGFTDSARDDEGRKYYCPDSAFLEGVLASCPQLRGQLDIRHVGYPRPRRELVELVGEAHQGCPNLILDPAHHGLVDAARFQRFGDRLHTTDTRVIVDYLAERHGAMVAHFSGGGSTRKNAPTSIDPLVAARLGFPKTRYVFLELERRWVCKSLPRELVKETVQISDRYVLGSNLRLREERSLSGQAPMLRLSRKVDVDDSTRLISSVYLQEPEFALLKAALAGRDLQKRRHRLRGPDDVILAVDEFDGPLAGLLLLEAEFTSVDDLRRFEAPWYAGAEVTSDPLFSGGNLAARGLPPRFGS